MAGENDEEAPHDLCAVWIAEHLPRCELILLGKTVGHYVFLPEATEAGVQAEPAICVDPPDVDRRQIHDRAAEQAITLFGYL